MWKDNKITGKGTRTNNTINTKLRTSEEDKKVSERDEVKSFIELPCFYMEKPSRIPNIK